MIRFVLPGGRWPHFVAGALVVTCVLSQAVVSRVLALMLDHGSLTPLRVQVAASPWWVVGCMALAILGIGAAGVLGRRRASAYLLTSTALLMVTAAILTTWAALALSCAPLGVVCCFGPIR